MTPLAPLVTGFFRSHLVADKGVSKNTIASYSYAFKFLCRFASERLGRTPSKLFLEDLDARMIRDFLEHLERNCGNTARTRNLRLTAIRSFMRYVEYEVPSALEQVRRVRAISNKRTDERLAAHIQEDFGCGRKATHRQPSSQCAGGLLPEWETALPACLSVDQDAGIRPVELEVVETEADQLRDA